MAEWSGFAPAPGWYWLEPRTRHHPAVPAYYDGADSWCVARRPETTRLDLWSAGVTIGNAFVNLGPVVGPLSGEVHDSGTRSEKAPVGDAGEPQPTPGAEGDRR